MIRLHNTACPLLLLYSLCGVIFAQEPSLSLKGNPSGYKYNGFPRSAVCEATVEGNSLDSFNKVINVYHPLLREARISGSVKGFALFNASGNPSYIEIYISPQVILKNQLERALKCLRLSTMETDNTNRLYTFFVQVDYKLMAAGRQIEGCFSEKNLSRYFEVKVDTVLISRTIGPAVIVVENPDLEGKLKRGESRIMRLEKKIAHLNSRKSINRKKLEVLNKKLAEQRKKNAEAK